MSLKLIRKKEWACTIEHATRFIRVSIGVAAIMLETTIDPISLINNKKNRSNCSYISFGIIKLEQNALPLLYICNVYKILAN